MQRRAVVDPVAGHRHDVTPGAQRLGDAQLVLRRHPGDDDPVPVEHGAEDLLVVGQVVADEDRIVDMRKPVSVAIAAAVAGWSPVIIATLIPARRHAAIASRTSARGGSSRASRPRARGRARRVSADDRHLAVDGSAGDRQHPQTLAGERLQASSADSSSTAQVEDCIRRALDDHLSVADDRHPSPSRIEWEAGGVDSAAAFGIRVDTEPAGEDIDRRFHRIAVRTPRAVDPAHES